MKGRIGNFILDLFFSKLCFGCQKEGEYLCQDCRAILGISGFHQTPNQNLRFSTGQEFQTGNLSDLYWAVEYKNPLIKNLIQKFKYEPFVKELREPLSLLIIDHFQLMDNPPNFADFLLVPVPLEKKKLKWRGFNQAEELAKELSSFLKIPLISDCLIKIKETLPQAELAGKEREESVRGVFTIRNQKKVLGKKILLVDDVYTTGATMEECARVLRKAGAKEIIGLVIARAKPGQDQF
jgi:ComF family protein